MDTNTLLRLRVLRFVQLFGINQKVLGARMGMTESQFSRWLWGGTRRPASVNAADGFQAFLEHIIAETTFDFRRLTSEEQANERARLARVTRAITPEAEVAKSWLKLDAARRAQRRRKRARQASALRPAVKGVKK